MRVHIHTLTKTLYDDTADSVSLPTQLGEITVLDNHIPLISLLQKGTVTIRSGGSEKAIPIQEGFLEVRAHNELVILVKN